MNEDERLEALLEATLESAHDPDMLDVLADMADDPDEDEAPEDEDDSPPDPAAQARVKLWLDTVARQRLRRPALPAGDEEDVQDWDAMSEADWQSFAASDWQPHKVTRGPNKGKMAWKHKTSGKISYEDPKVKEKQAKAAEAAKAKAKEKAAKEKEKAAAAAAKAKEKEAQKAAEKKTKALATLRAVASGTQKVTAARTRDIGAMLVTLKADELKALKTELGVKGGSTKQAMIEKIQARALAGKPAVAKAKPEPKAKAPPKAKPETKVEPKVDPVVAQADVARGLLDDEELTTGGLVSIRQFRQRLSHLSKEEFDQAVQELVRQGVLTPHRENFAWSDDKTDADRALLVPSILPNPYGGDRPDFYMGLALDTRNPNAQKALEDLASKSGPPQPPEPGFTGTDSLGREWRDGKLVAKGEEPKAAKPAAPADSLEARRQAMEQEAAAVREAERRRAAGPVNPAPPAVVADAYERIRRANARLGGIVKVPDLYDEVKKAHPSLTLEDFHAQLEQMQREDRLTLQLVNDPRLEPRAGEMVKTSRGLRGYVQMRPDAAKPAQTPQSSTTAKADPAEVANRLQDAYTVAADLNTRPEMIEQALEPLGDMNRADLVRVAEAFELHGMRGRPPEEIRKAIWEKMSNMRGSALRSNMLYPPEHPKHVTSPHRDVQPPSWLARDQAATQAAAPAPRPARPAPTPRPAKPTSAATPRTPRAEAALQQIRAVYEGSTQTPAQINAAYDQAVAGLSREELVSVAEGMDLVVDSGWSKAKVLETIKHKVREAHGSRMRSSMLRRPEESADVNPKAVPTAKPKSTTPVEVTTLNRPGTPGHGAQRRTYDADAIDPDFRLPNEPALMRDALPAIERIAAANYSVVNTGQLYDELKQSHPSLTVDDFLTQVLAWQKRGLISLGAVNDPHLMPKEELEKMPVLRREDSPGMQTDFQYGFIQVFDRDKAEALAAKAR